MKSKIFIPIALFVIFLMATPQVLALEIQVDNNGTVRFYDDSVLGKNTDNTQTVSKQAIKTVPAQANQSVNIRPNTDTTEVRLVEKSSRSSTEKDAFDSTESIEAESLKMEFSAQSAGNQTRTFQQNQEEYLQQLQEQKQERAQEMVEVRNRIQNNGQVLELQTRQATALLKDGAEFNLDPETNEITVTTPSGQEHVLNHLPDQAISRMVEVGLLDDADGEQEIEVEVYDNGDLYYHKPDKIQKRLFGVIPVQIDSELVLNDNTGEVVENEAAPDTIFEQFLNAVSF